MGWKKFVPNDPRTQNRNGKLFEQFLQKNPHLSVANALSFCDGGITFARHTRSNTEESVLDFFIVCNQILPVVKKMLVHNKGEITLARYKDKIVKTDHRMLVLEINLEFHNNKKHDRLEVFNVRNKICQKQFYEFTSKGDTFSKCFDSKNEIVDTQFDRWQRKFNKAICACFRKIRIKGDSERKPSKMDDLIDKKKLYFKGNQ